MPFKLHSIAAKHPDVALKASVIKLAQSVIEQAEKGEIDGLVVIKRHPDNRWNWDASAPHVFSEVVGRLEILKHEWIDRYLYPK